MRFIRLFIILALLSFAVPASAQDVAVALDDFPPWKIIKGDRISGIDIELVTALLAEVDLKPRYEICPWSRCLEMIKDGQADIITGILKRPEREKDMIFIEPPYKTKSSKAFYIREDMADITTFDGLHSLTIGIKRDVKYFKQFDEDTTLIKDAVHEDDLNFRKLAAGRVDVVVITESIGDYLLSEMGLTNEIKKTTYRHDTVVPVYFAISKDSPFAHRVQDFNAASRRLSSAGVFNGIIRNFFKRLQKTN